MSDYGISRPGHQDPDDPNSIEEGTALKRVQVGGRDYVVLGGAWYVRVCTGEAGERFWGLAVAEPDIEGDVGVWLEGIRKALPDLDGEGNPVPIAKDQALTNIGVSVAGTLRPWDSGTQTADEIVCYCERPVEVDEPSIKVRLGVH